MGIPFIKSLSMEYYEPCPAPEFGHVFKLMGPPFDDIWVRMLCSRPWCPNCEPVRVWRMRIKIHKYLIHNNPKNLWLVTRSVRNEARLIDGFRTLHECNQTFNNQIKEPGQHPFHGFVTSSIGTYEVTYKYNTGYNVHQHIIIGSHADKHISIIQDIMFISI